MSDTERWRNTAYWRALPRWKRTLLEPGNEDAWFYRYFGDRITTMKDFHYRLIDSSSNKTKALVLYPAGHGKTTLTSTLLPILWICRWPNIRILIIAKNDLEASNIANVIQSHLIDNQLLMRDFGPFKPSDDRPWALDKMIVAGRTVADKTPTLVIVGQRSKAILGTRTDWTICDDVVTDENSASPTQRVKMRGWFDDCVDTGPEFADSRLTVVGTRFDPHDLYGDIVELAEIEGQDWHIQREDAIVDEEKRIPLWPEVWSWERLMQKKARGVLSFNKRYRNIAVDASRMVVKEQFITGGFYDKTNYPGCLDRRHKIGDLSDAWRIVTGFDPAAGVTRSAKFCAHMTLGLGSCRDHERCIWIIDLLHGQYTLPQQIELLLGQHEKYAAAKSIIEINAYQAGLLQALEEKMRERGIAHDFEPHYTTRTNKPDPELGVGAMSSWFEKGMVHIPWGDAHSQRVMRQFVDEIVQYPDGRTSDTVMAFWFAWRHMQESMPRYESFNRLDRHRDRERVHAPRFGVRVVKNPFYAREGV